MKNILILVFSCLAFCTKGQTPINIADQTKKTTDAKNYFYLGYGFIQMSESGLVGDVQTAAPFDIRLGPVYLEYEYRVMEKFSVGLSYAYMYDHNNQTDNSGSETFKTYSILIRLNWHSLVEKKFSTYGGIGLGYRYYFLEKDSYFPAAYNYSSHTITTILSTYYRNDGHVNNEIPIGFEATFGVKYLISRYLDAYSEIGLAKSLIQFGIVYKI